MDLSIGLGITWYVIPFSCNPEMRSPVITEGIESPYFSDELANLEEYVEEWYVKWRNSLPPNDPSSNLLSIQATIDLSALSFALANFCFSLSNFLCSASSAFEAAFCNFSCWTMEAN